MLRHFESETTSPAHIITVSETGGQVPDRIIVPDSLLLFSAAFKKSGPDLILTGQDGTKILIVDYFRHEKRPFLVTPDGASLSADVVELLAGPDHAAQYAQVGAPAGAKVIGQVERLGGSAVVQHANGAVAELKVGDPMYQGDVVQTRDGSQLGLSLVDGSAFNMGANARMVLNELVYEPNSTSNSSLVSLVKGTIGFVAGQVAKTGDMKIETPVATMGIRGTSGQYAVATDQDIQSIVDNAGNTISVTVSLIPDPDQKIGSFLVLNKFTGAILGSMTTIDSKIVITPFGNDVLTSSVLKTAEDTARDLAQAQVLYPIYLAQAANYQTQQTTPDQQHDQTPRSGPHGSSSAAIQAADLDVSPDVKTVVVPPSTTSQGQGSQDHGGQTVTVHVNVPPTVFALVPDMLDEQVSKGQPGVVVTPGVPTVFSQITKVDIDGQALYDTAALTKDGWFEVDPGSGIYTKLATYGAVTLNTGAPSVLTAAALIALGWTDVGSGYFQKSYNFSGLLETVRVNIGADTITYALDPARSDALGPPDHVSESQTFTIPVMDNGGATASTEVTFTIQGENDVPNLLADALGPHKTSEIAGVTGGAGQEKLDSTLSFTDPELAQHHTSSVALGTLSWSGSTPTIDIPTATKTAAAAAATMTSTVSTDSFGTGAGTVAWHFTLNDKLVDFLADGETLTLTYKVSVTDDYGLTSTQPVAITITGQNDDPVLAPDAQAPHNASEALDTTDDAVGQEHLSGTLSFTDVDLTNTHTASAVLSSDPGSAVWSGGSTIPSATASAIGTALTASVATGTASDSTGTGSGTLSWDFKIADNLVDFLAKDETLTLTYDVTVKDSSGATSTQKVTVVVKGTNDTPTITSNVADASGSLSELPGTTGDSADTDKALGTITFRDVDLSDSHNVSKSAPTFIWTSSGSPLTLDAGQIAALTTASTLDLTKHDSTGTGLGSVDWKYTVVDSALDFLREGETLTVTYDVTITDNIGASITVPVVVTIAGTGANDQPVITSTVAQLSDGITEATDVTNSGAPDTADGLVKFSDADLSDVDHINHGDATAVWNKLGGGSSAITDAAIVAASHLTFGTVDQAANSATWTYTVTDGALDFLRAGETLVVTYNITVQDNSGASNDTSTTKQIVVTITGANDRPQITSTTADLSGSIYETAHQTGVPADHSTGGTVFFSDADINDTDHINHSDATAVWTHSDGTTSAVSLAAIVGASHLTFGAVDQSLDRADWTYHVADNSLDFLAAGEKLTVTYAVTVQDNSGDASTDTSAPHNVVVTLYGADDKPAITPVDVIGAVTEDATKPNLTDHGSVTFTDPDLTDTSNASIVLTGSPTTTSAAPIPSDLLTALGSAMHLTGDTTDAHAGTVTWNFALDNNLVQYLGAGEQINASYRISITDKGGEVSTQDVSMTITGVNDAPVAVADNLVMSSSLFGNSGAVISPSWLLANDYDPDATDVISLNGVDGSQTLGHVQISSGNIVYIPPPSGTDTFKYTVHDLLNTVSNAAQVSVSVQFGTQLTGTSGADTIVSGANANVLNGLAGNDTLIGGAGNDTFVFGSYAGGHHDTIGDFANGDLVDVTTFGLTATTLQHIITNAGAGHTLDFGGGNLLTFNIAANQLHTTDFLGLT